MSETGNRRKHYCNNAVAKTEEIVCSYVEELQKVVLKKKKRGEKSYWQ